MGDPRGQSHLVGESRDNSHLWSAHEHPMDYQRPIISY